MGLLKYLLFGLIIIFPIAELGRFQVNSIAFSVNDLILFITILVWIFLNFKTLKLKKYKLTKPILVFVSVGFVSLVLNPLKLDQASFLTSLLYLLRWVLYSFFYFMLVSQDKKFLKFFSDFLLVPITIILIIGYIQFIFYQSLRNLFYLGWDEHLYRLFASFLDPNFAGSFLVLSCGFLAYKTILAYKEKSNIKFKFLIFLSFFNFLAIYLTYSRSALIMLFVTLVVLLILIKRKKLFIFLIIPFILFIIISPKSFQTEGTNLFRIASGEARIESLAVALGIIEKHPILGVGFNAYRYAQNKYANLTDSKWQVTHSGAGTDNSFFFVLATTGIVGLMAFAYLLFNIFSLGVPKYGKNLFAAIFIASLAGLLVNSLFINSLFYVYILEWIWITAAIMENT